MVVVLDFITTTHIETLAYKVETRAVTTITVHYDYVEIKMESNDDKSVPEPTT